MYQRTYTDAYAVPENYRGIAVEQVREKEEEQTPPEVQAVHGEPLYECKINLDELYMLADVADAATYFGAELYSAEALPMAFSGRNNTQALIFGLKNANLGGFFTYLALEYPQTATVGIYTKLVSGAKNDYSWN